MSETRTCQVTNCETVVIALGFCATDYARYRRGTLPGYEPLRSNRSYTYRERTPATGLCQGPECSRPARAKNLCEAHAEQVRRGAELTPLRTSRAARGCKEPGCDYPHEAHGYCSTHYNYATGRGEIPTSTRNRRIRKDGYAAVWAPGHSEAQVSGYALEHRVVMSEILGRPLYPGENAHHLNGVRDDNRPENLELWVSSQPKGQRVEDLVAWAREILDRYAAPGEHEVSSRP